MDAVFYPLPNSLLCLLLASCACLVEQWYSDTVAGHIAHTTASKGVCMRGNVLQLHITDCHIVQLHASSMHACLSPCLINHLQLASATCSSAQHRLGTALLLQLINLAEIISSLQEGLTEWPNFIVGCQNVRNRNLAILSRSRLKMQSLAVGHVSTTSYGKPRITNQVKTLLKDRIASLCCAL